MISERGTTDVETKRHMRGCNNDQSVPFLLVKTRPLLFRRFLCPLRISFGQNNVGENPFASESYILLVECSEILPARLQSKPVDVSIRSP